MLAEPLVASGSSVQGKDTSASGVLIELVL